MYTHLYSTCLDRYWFSSWSCPCARPSVRPSFQDLFSTCFEISVSNFVYTFSWCHDISSSSSIAIGSIWPNLQQWGQICFLQAWPHEKINSSNLVHKWPAVYFSTQVPFFLHKSYFPNFDAHFCAFWIFRSLRGFFLHIFKYDLTLGIYIW